MNPINYLTNFVTALPLYGTYLIYNYFNCFASTSFILVTWDPSYSITFVAVITCFLKLSCIETVMEHLSFSHYTDWCDDWSDSWEMVTILSVWQSACLIKADYLKF